MKNKDKGRLPPFIPILKETWESPAWKALSFGARLLYIALKGLYNNQFHNNGRIFLSHRRAAEVIGSDKDPIAGWFRELQFFGFIVKTRNGYLGFDGKGQAPRWRLTEVSFMKDPPTRDFMRWNGAKFTDQENRIPSGNSGQGVRKKRTVVSGKNGHSMEQVSGKSGQRDGPRCPEKADKSNIPLGGAGGALSEEQATSLTLPLMTVLEGGKSAHDPPRGMGAIRSA